ncbi:MAG: endonuclease domain-containing protein [Calditrichaeota bacterium]|nr:MAG: endonuclease domain-containing protein [Calditrichota bacterium]
MIKRLHNLKYLEAKRKELRNQATAAEIRLWKALQKRQLAGRKFRRQHSVGKYILDFYCPAERLCIELDGAHYGESIRLEYDEKRTAFLQSIGIRALRFENKLVFEDIESVLNEIQLHFK